MITPLDLDWDDALIEATRNDEQPHATAYRPPQAAVVLGRGSKPEVEVNLDAVEEDAVPLLKRRGGGCSVVLDTGNVIVSATLPLSGVGGISTAFDALSEWVIEALAHAGVANVRQAGISDLVVGDRKIGGACMYRTKGLVYYSATLLFAPDLDLVERYLRHPPREPAYRKGRTHRAFMGSLDNLVSPTDITAFTEDVDTIFKNTVGDIACHQSQNKQEVSV